MNKEYNYKEYSIEDIYKPHTYIKQKPYVGNDGIYVPLEGCARHYKCILTKEMFVEAYNKWIKE